MRYLDLLPQLAAFHVYLRSSMAGILPKTNGHLVRGAMLHLVGRYFPDAASALHTARDKRPCTFSAVHPYGKGDDVDDDGERPPVPPGHIFISPHRDYRFRVTCLDARWLHTLAHCLQAEPTLTLDDNRFSIAGSPFSSHENGPEEDPRSDLRADNYLDLKDRAFSEPLPRDRVKIGFTFVSATAIKKQNDEVYLFPDPQTLFSNLFKRWNSICKDSFPRAALPEHLMEHLNGLWRVKSYKLHTRMLMFPKLREKVGFEGDVEFEADRRGSENDPAIRLSILLGWFSQYSGIGGKGMYGMGQVRFRVIKSDRSRREGQ